MQNVSPEIIGSPVRIVDDQIEEKSCWQFRQEDLFNIVNDLNEINNLITISASEVLAKTKIGEPVDYDNVIIEGDLDIRKLDLTKDEKGFFIIISPIRIRNSLICGKVYFTTTIFKEPVDFMNSQFGSDAYFYESKLDGSIFQQSIFNGVANFRDSEFISNAYFSKSIYYSEANFYLSKFNGLAAFTKSQFWDTINFGGTTFKGDVLTFKDARFKDPRAQEEACRRAKNVLEKNGDREAAAYYFYKEMEAKRKQKGFVSGRNIPYNEIGKSLRAENWSILKRLFWYDILEYVFVQSIFGYGVHPNRLMVSWGAIVVVFGILFWIGNGVNGATGWFDYLKFSFATAIAPGYIASIINPGSTGYSLLPEYQAAAMAESILGTFLWAGFIATFAKKYMR